MSLRAPIVSFVRCQYTQIFSGLVLIINHLMNVLRQKKSEEKKTD